MGGSSDGVADAAGLSAADEMPAPEAAGQEGDEGQPAAPACPAASSGTGEALRRDVQIPTQTSYLFLFIGIWGMAPLWLVLWVWTLAWGSLGDYGSHSACS